MLFLEYLGSCVAEHRQAIGWWNQMPPQTANAGWGGHPVAVVQWLQELRDAHGWV